MQNKAELLDVGRERKEATLPEKGQKGFQNALSNNDKTLEPHDTRKAIAATLNMSTGKVAQAEYVMKNALTWVGLVQDRLTNRKRGPWVRAP